MIDTIIKHQHTGDVRFSFSILIPTWNNIEYFKNCIQSIQKNSTLPIQIIAIINEGIDGTKTWLEEQKNIDFIYSPTNIGICYALNIARSMVKSDYIVYANDDMYFLPNWDTTLQKEIDALHSKKFMFSCTMIEPRPSHNSCVIVKDYGQDITDFNEELLLKEYHTLYTDHWTGSTWPPTIVHIDVWDLVGGYSAEFSPGMYSDPDFSKKLYDAGVRNFKGIGNSLIYHFGSKTVNRVKKNKGRNTFIQKWGMTSRTFTENYLKSGSIYSGEIDTVNLSAKNVLINKIKRVISCW